MPSATVTVIGGGPAGLMAAEVLATAGAAVTVVERMPTVGRKLQVAGRGGLNLTHSEPLPALLERYGPARERLAPAIERFDPAALRSWATSLGEGTFIGSSGRVFPDRFRATALLRAWLRRLEALGVDLRTRHSWTGWDDHGSPTCADEHGANVTLPCDACVLALGGASWPRTGSDGSWVPVIATAGIEVTQLRAANCGALVEWSDQLRARFAGTALKDVVLHLHGAEARGDVVITERGVEGGPIYAIGRELREALRAAPNTVVALDARPDQTVAELATHLDRRRPKDSAATGLRRAGIAPAVVGLLREVTGNQPPEGSAATAALLKSLPVEVQGLAPIERAISTAGGIALDAVDERWMLVHRPGTFVAGEMLDWDAPTGGYLLQACFSTGVAAAEGALAWLAEGPR